MCITNRCSGVRGRRGGNGAANLRRRTPKCRQTHQRRRAKQLSTAQPQPKLSTLAPTVSQRFWIVEQVGCIWSATAENVHVLLHVPLAQLQQSVPDDKALKTISVWTVQIFLLALLIERDVSGSCRTVASSTKALAKGMSKKNPQSAYTQARRNGTTTFYPKQARGVICSFLNEITCTCCIFVWNWRHE